MSNIKYIMLIFKDGITEEQAQQVSSLAEKITDRGITQGGFVAFGEGMYSTDSMDFLLEPCQDLKDDGYNKKEFESWWFKLCHSDPACFFRDVLRTLKPVLWAEYKRTARAYAVVKEHREQDGQRNKTDRA